MKYIITSGFCSKGDCPYPWSEELHHHNIEKSNEFHELWEEILFKYTNPKDVLVINSPEPSNKHKKVVKINTEWIDMLKNFGHQSGHIEGQYCGWTRAWLLGMFYAFINDCDHIYVEQDVLCFGNWIEAIYDTGKLLSFGHKKYGGKMYDQENSVTFIKKEAIPRFLNRFLSIEGTDKEIHAERKITQVRNDFKDKAGYHPFGYGFRFPPERLELPFYVHRLSYDRLEYLAEAGLIDKKYIKLRKGKL